MLIYNKKPTNIFVKDRMEKLYTFCYKGNSKKKNKNKTKNILTNIGKQNTNNYYRLYL